MKIIYSIKKRNDGEQIQLSDLGITPLMADVVRRNVLVPNSQLVSVQVFLPVYHQLVDRTLEEYG